MARFWFTAGGAALASAAVAYLSQSGFGANLLLAQLTPLPLFLAGLSIGATGGAAAGLGAAIALLPLVGILGTGVYLATVAAPSAILLRQALVWRQDEDGKRVWYPCGLLLAVLTGIGVALAFLAPAILESQEGYEAFLQAIAKALAEAAKLGEPEALIESLRRLFPAATAISWMMTLFISGSLAQWILVRSGRNLRPSPDFSTMTLPDWLATVAAVAGMVTLIAPGWLVVYSLGVLTVLCLPFFLQGLAVVHALNRKIGGGFAVVLIFYVIVAVQVWPVLPIFVLGVVEQFVSVRRRWMGGTEHGGAA